MSQGGLKWIAVCKMVSSILADVAERREPQNLSASICLHAGAHAVAATSSFFFFFFDFFFATSGSGSGSGSGGTIAVYTSLNELLQPGPTGLAAYLLRRRTLRRD